jgi:hypothetical protein
MGRPIRQGFADKPSRLVIVRSSRLIGGQPMKAIPFESAGKKLCRRGLVAPLGQPEVLGFPKPVDSTIEADPLTALFDTGLGHQPG